MLVINESLISTIEFCMVINYPPVKVFSFSTAFNNWRNELSSFT